MKPQDSNIDIHSQFYRYLSAYILVALSGCLGNVVDGIIVGNLISEDGVSAINLSKPIGRENRYKTSILGFAPVGEQDANAHQMSHYRCRR